MANDSTTVDQTQDQKPVFDPNQPYQALPAVTAPATSADESAPAASSAKPVFDPNQPITLLSSPITDTSTISAPKSSLNVTANEIKDKLLGPAGVMSVINPGQIVADHILTKIENEIENYTPQGREDHPVLSRIGDIVKNGKEFLMGGQAAGKPMGTSGGALDAAQILAVPEAAEAAAGGEAALREWSAARQAEASTPKVDIRSNIEDFFHPDPDAQAQIAAKPSPKKAQKFQQDLVGARPYLEGATNLKELQENAAAGMKEVWGPYKKAIDGLPGDVAVIGPDGSNTVRGLEAERVKTSAELDQWRSLRPIDRAVQLQKSQKIQDLTQRYQDITEAIDPVLRQAGLDPTLIRTTYGQIKGVAKTLAGRNTLSEAANRYGLGRLFNINLQRPGDYLPELSHMLQDLGEGRVLGSEKPTDAAVRQGFSTGTGGPKPNLEPGPPATTPPAPTEPQQTIVRQEAEGTLPPNVPITGGGGFPSALNEGSKAANTPDWVAGEFQHEIQRLEGITRDPKATAEEKSIAQSMLDHTRELSERITNPNQGAAEGSLTPAETYYHGTNSAEDIRKNGFKTTSGEDSSYLGDNYVDGIYLSKDKTPYQEGGQLEDVKDVLPVKVNTNKILKVDSFGGIGDLYKKYNISETSDNAAAQLTQALKDDGYEGLDSGNEVVIFDPKHIQIAEEPTSKLDWKPEAGTKFYHGTKADVSDVSQLDASSFSKPNSLMGLGTYFTDNPEVASGYAQTKGTGAGRVLGAKLPEGKYLNAEAPASDEIREAFQKAAPSDAEKLDGDTARELFNSLRDSYADAGWSTNDAMDGLQDLTINLRKQGYDGLRYEGGQTKLGQKYGPHNVAVVFPDYEGNPVKVEPATPSRHAEPESKLAFAASKAGLEYKGSLEGGNGQVFHTFDDPAKPGDQITIRDSEIPKSGVSDFLKQRMDEKRSTSVGGGKTIEDLRKELLGQTKLEQPQMVATPENIKEFKDWFGKSKIVDAEGKPAVAYHGTTSPVDFEEFSTDGPPHDEEGNELVSSSGDPNAYMGAHFAIGDNAPRIASKFAENKEGWMRSRFEGEEPKPRVIPVHLKLENPIEFKSEDALNDFINQGHISNEELLNEAARADGIEDPEEGGDKLDAWQHKYDTDPKFRAEQNEWILSQNPSAFGYEDSSALHDAAAELGQDARGRLSKQGYDGVIYKNQIEGGKAAIAFEPEQIRPAIANKEIANKAFQPKLEQPALKPSPIPQAILNKVPGHTVESVIHHELGHVLEGDRVGIPFTEIQSHLHPSAGSNNIASAVMDFSKLPTDETGLIPYSNVADVFVDKYLPMYLGGGAINDIVDGIPFKVNRGLSGDLQGINTGLKYLDFTPSEMEDIIESTLQEQKNRLTNDPALGILKQYAAEREEGLPETHLMSAQRVKQFLKDVAQARKGTPYEIKEATTGNVKGSAKPSDEVIQQPELRAEGTGPKADLREGNGKTVQKPKVNPLAVAGLGAAAAGLNALGNQEKPKFDPNAPVERIGGEPESEPQPQVATKTAVSRKEIPDLLDKAAEDYNLPVSLLYAQAQQESRMNQAAVSPKGAIGIMQLEPATARSLGVDPHDVEDNIKGGAQLMAQLRQKYNNDDEKALSAYNWGETKTDAAIRKYGTNWKKHIPSETSHYIKAILAQQEK